MQKHAERHFRFFDNREKYLLFVATCGEKWAIAERVGEELDRIAPKPPALRLFDAGMGDGTVLSSLLRHLHQRFPTVPFFVVGKEISIEDVRLTLRKLPDRIAEHPQTVFVVTNMHYAEAPWLEPASPERRSKLHWREIALEGQDAHEFDGQIDALRPLLNDWWQVSTNEKSGNPLYVTPSVLLIYRADQRFLLDSIIPQQGGAEGLYDLIVAAQPYRARQPAETKVRTVLEPLAKALAPGGRMVAIQSTGLDPGMEVIREVWPEEMPFRTPGPMLLGVLRERLRETVPERGFSTDGDRNILFRYALHTLPGEVSGPIGTSTLLAAWNAAIYVAQMDDRQVAEAMSVGRYLEATREVLMRHGGLWFIDESFVVARD